MIEQRMYQVALGQQLETSRFVRENLSRHAAWGYTHLLLYLEGAYRFPSHPDFAQAQAWTPAEMRRVVQEASAHHIKVIPCVPSLGHTQYLLSHPKYRHLSERRETLGKDGLPIAAGQVCPSLEETYQVLGDLYQDVAPFCTAGILHVSLDESMDLGLCSRCKGRLQKEGYDGLFLAHLLRLHGIVTGLGLRMAVWGDMFYYFPQLIAKLPKDVIVFDWYYYPFARRPRVELYNFREVPSAERLRRAGLEVWGTPQMGGFFYEPTVRYTPCLQNAADWWRYGQKTRCAALALTTWFSPHVPAEFTVLGNAAAAELWLGDAHANPKKMLLRGLERLYGRAGRRMLRVVQTLERHPLVGYWEWQLFSQPLHAMATLDGDKQLHTVQRQLAKAAQQATAAGAPPLFAEAVRVRTYLAVKERLCREGSRWLLKARQAQAAGRLLQYHQQVRRLRALVDECQLSARHAARATDALWRVSRPAKLANPLRQTLKTDLTAYAGLERHLRAAEHAPARIQQSCPLMGSRHLVVTVRTSRPCLQGLEISVSTDGKTFTPLKTLYTLEFRGESGQPHTNFVRCHAVSLPDDLPAGALLVRYRRTGVGELEISDPQLLDGPIIRTPCAIASVAGQVKKAKRLLRADWTRIGQPAPKVGFITPASMEEMHAVTVEFA